MVQWCWVNFQCRVVLLIWITVGQGPTALTVGAGGGCLDIFTLIYPFSPFSPSLWEMARYRLKYCLKGPLNPNQPTNQQPRFSAIFSEGNKFRNFLFSTLADESLQTWGQYLKERICSWKSKFFPLRIEPHVEAEQKRHSCFP